MSPKHKIKGTGKIRIHELLPELSTSWLTGITRLFQTLR
jgi:hypothetical protein